MNDLSVWSWLIGGAALWFLYRLLVQPVRGGANETRRGRRELPTGGNGFATEVVGEAHYQRALESLAGGRSEDGAEEYVRAVLVPEDDNPHDSNAVRVEIDGKKVGYLSREDARRWRAISGGSRRQECPAVIVGGWDRGDGDRGHFGVRLDLNL